MSDRNGSHTEQDSLERLSDRELIGRFANSRDDEAFRLLVSRHGKLVYGVCRRILRHHQDAEDAFQATFVILARKAGKVRWQKSLANWLYSTACRVAMKAHVAAQKRREAPMSSESVVDSEALDQVARNAACRALDEELNQLPEKYRSPLVLCYLEGKTREQAAEELGLTPAAIKGRLHRGRHELRLRLLRRGVGLSLGAAGGGLAISTGAAGANWIESAVSNVPEGLEATTVELATRLASGEPIGGIISTQALQLAEGEFIMLSSSILKPITATAVAAALVGISCMVLSTSVLADKPEQGRLAIRLSTEGRVDKGGAADEDLVHAGQFQVVSNNPTETESGPAVPSQLSPEQRRLEAAREVDAASAVRDVELEIERIQRDFASQLGEADRSDLYARLRNVKRNLDALDQLLQMTDTDTGTQRKPVRSNEDSSRALWSDSMVVFLERDSCAKCDRMIPTIETLQAGGYPIVRINMDRVPGLASRLGHRSAPSLTVLRDNKEVAHIYGAVSERIARRFLENEVPLDR